MNKGWVFLLGFISGAVFLFVFLLIPASLAKDNSGMTFFEEEGQCLSTRPFEVFQVLDDGVALASEIARQNSLSNMTTDLMVLLINDKGEYYYDDQVVTIPDGMCMRQVGIYKYTTRGGIDRTVPIAKISQ